MWNYWWGYRTDTGLCEPLWSIRLFCQLMTKLGMMRILQAQMCGCISAHPGLPHQKPKRETSDASKSQLNQASWNRAVLKFDLENQLTVNPFSWFLPWLHDLDKVTPLSSWLGMRRKGPWCWRMWELLAFEHVKTMVDKKTRFEKLNPCSTC